MSARAAWRLESLGFSQVFFYNPGKADWLANGLPIEGQRANWPHAGDLARRDVLTCRLTDQIGQVREQVWAAGQNVCVVVSDDKVVLGLLREEALAADPQRLVEQVMESGPRTYRLGSSLQKAAEFMHKQGVESVLVTTSDGRLVGLLYLSDIDENG